MNDKKRYRFLTDHGIGLNYLKDKQRLICHLRIPTLKEFYDLQIDEFYLVNDFHLLPEDTIVDEDIVYIKLTQHTWKKRVLHSWLDRFTEKGRISIRPKKDDKGKLYYSRDVIYGELHNLIPIDYEYEHGHFCLIDECDWYTSVVKINKCVFIRLEIRLSDLANEEIAKFPINDQGEFIDPESHPIKEPWNTWWAHFWHQKNPNMRRGPVLNKFKEKYGEQAEVQKMLDGGFYFTY